MLATVAEGKRTRRIRPDGVVIEAIRFLGPNLANHWKNVGTVPGTVVRMRNGANKGVRMTTEDVVSSTPSTRSRARAAGFGLLGGVALLGLAGCAAGDTYIDGWWDNGDPVLVPAKSALFDDEGVPLCSTPIAFGQVETRYRSYGETGGVVNAWLFEVTNPETDPATAESPEERRKLEVLARSTEAMYQLTFPAFDKEHGISGPDDMRAIKDQWQEKLPDVLTEGPATSYVKIDSQWIDGPEGRFTVRRADNPKDFIAENKINTTFNGVANQYFIAQRVDDGKQFLLVRNKDTGLATLMSSDEDDIVLDEKTESFIRYFIENESTGNNPDASLTLVNDQCRPVGGATAARYWVYDFEFLNGTEQGPNVIE